MDQKIRINWAISYFFLWELFLLAKSNPQFNHPFIRGHSYKATKIHFTFLLGFFLYNYLFAKFFYFNIPVLSVTVHFVLMANLVALFIFILIRWAYSAYEWKSAKEIWIRKDILRFSEESIDWELTEAQIMLYLASNLPFVGTYVATKHPSWVNRYWEKISWYFSVLIVLFVITSHTDALQILMLLYIAYLVFTWVMAFVHSKIMYSEFIDSLWELKSIHIYAKSIFYYLIESLKLIIWKKNELSFEAIIEKQVEKEQRYRNLADEYLSDTSIMISNKLIYIPILNIIFLPKYLVDRKSRYAIAIAQWLIITALMISLYFYDRTLFFTYQLVFLFPIVLWMANIDSDPFYKIPVIFELYSLADKLSFWIFSKVKFLKEKKNEVVSFKV